MLSFGIPKRKQMIQTAKKLPAKKVTKKVVKKQHGGKRPGGGRKRTMVYPKEMGPTKPVAFQVPTKKIDEVKKLVQDKLAEYRKTV